MSVADRIAEAKQRAEDERTAHVMQLVEIGYRFDEIGVMLDIEAEEAFAAWFGVMEALGAVARA